MKFTSKPTFGSVLALALALALMGPADAAKAPTNDAPPIDGPRVEAPLDKDSKLKPLPGAANARFLPILRDRSAERDADQEATFVLPDAEGEQIANKATAKPSK
jgi:hypothetical protein